MVVEANPQEPRALDELPRELHVLLRGGWLAGRMIVAKNQVGGALAQRRAQHLARMDDRGGQAPRGDEVVPGVAVLGVQEDHPEVFAIVVVGRHQLPGELGRCRGAGEGRAGRGAVLPGDRVRHRDAAVAPAAGSGGDAWHSYPPQGRGSSTARAGMSPGTSSQKGAGEPFVSAGRRTPAPGKKRRAG